MTATCVFCEHTVDDACTDQTEADACDLMEQTPPDKTFSGRPFDKMKPMNLARGDELYKGEQLVAVLTYGSEDAMLHCRQWFRQQLDEGEFLDK